MRPNIVLILTDQHHIDALGHAGALPVHTPHIDRLAREGTRFSHAFCCAAICSPSRAALFTGQWPHRFGYMGNEISLADPGRHLAQRMAEADYRLGYIGKWHADESRMPTSLGFEGHDFPGYGNPGGFFRSEKQSRAQQLALGPYYEYLVENGYDVPHITHPVYTPGQRPRRLLSGRHSGPVESSIPWFLGTSACDQLRSFARRGQHDGRPFFSWINFWGPHNPHVIPEPYDTMYDPASIPEPPSAGDPFEGKPHVQPRFSQFWGMYGEPWSAWQPHIAHYLGYVTLIDEQVGRIRAALEETGQWDSTLVVFAADHGDMLGRHQQIDKGPFAYDDIYRVPMIATGPGVARGHTCHELAYVQELFGTFVDTATGQAPTNHDFGRSLRPYFTADADHAAASGATGRAGGGGGDGDGGGGGEGREAVFTTYDSLVHLHFPHRAVRTRTHKYVYNSTDRCELYDLERDPHEMRNVVDDPAYADVKADLKTRLLVHLQGVSDAASRRMAACYDWI
ncbi:MAG: sulfatase-like hydrolase/transferase [Phycisphaeraceae bacterium]